MFRWRAWQSGFLLIAAVSVVNCHAYDETLLESGRSRLAATAEPAPRPTRPAIDAGNTAEPDDTAAAPPSDDASFRDSADASPQAEARDSAAADGGEGSAMSDRPGPPEADGGAANAGGAGGGSAGAGGSPAAPLPIAGASGSGPVAEIVVSCPDANARVWNVNGHCYFPLSVLNSWFVSRDRCRELGAQLVTITSADEQAFVSTLVGGVTRWTGLSRFGAPAFSWVGEESVTYENWEMGAPNATTEAAAAIRADTFLWYDESVSQPHASICERQ